MALQQSIIHSRRCHTLHTVYHVGVRSEYRYLVVSQVTCHGGYQDASAYQFRRYVVPACVKALVFYVGSLNEWLPLVRYEVVIA